MLEKKRGRLFAPQNGHCCQLLVRVTCSIPFSSFPPHPEPQVDSLLWPEDISGDNCYPQELFRCMRGNSSSPPACKSQLFGAHPLPTPHSVPSSFPSASSVKMPLWLIVFPFHTVTFSQVRLNSIIIIVIIFIECFLCAGTIPSSTFIIIFNCYYDNHD